MAVINRFTKQSPQFPDFCFLAIGLGEGEKKKEKLDDYLLKYKTSACQNTYPTCSLSTMFDLNKEKHCPLNIEVIF